MKSDFVAMLVHVPRLLRYRLKVAAASREITLGSFVIEALEFWVAGHPGAHNDSR